jgi:hypothetical protein
MRRLRAKLFGSFRQLGFDALHLTPSENRVVRFPKISTSRFATACDFLSFQA